MPRPARRPRSCSPPTKRGSNRLPRPHDTRARTRHTSELVRADADQVGVEPGQVDRYLSQAAAASTWTGTPVPGRERRPRPRVGVSRLRGCPIDSGPAPVGGGRSDPRRSRTASTWIRPLPSTGMSSVGARRADASPHRRVLDGAHRTGRPGAARVAAQTAAFDRLGRTPGEDHLASRHAQQVGNLPPRLLERVAHRCDPPGGGGQGRRRRAAHRVSAASASAAAGSYWRGRDRRGPLPGSGGRGAGVVARAREERITGSAWRDAVPQSPESSPLTMPRSTAHSAGFVLLASPKGHCSAITGCGLAAVFRVGREAVGRERVRHDVHGGPHRALRPRWRSCARPGNARIPRRRALPSPRPLRAPAFAWPRPGVASGGRRAAA